MDVVIRRKKIEGIPLLELSPADIIKHPLVLMIHGYGNRKDFMLNQGYFLASQGYMVALPDAWGHGERSPGGIPNFFEAVQKTADEIDTIIDYYKEISYAGAERIGLVGYSMGGCVVYEFVCRPGCRAKAAAAVIGTPDWVSLMSMPATAQLFLQYGLITSPDDMQALVGLAGRIHPAAKAENARVPLLMLNGADDPLMDVPPIKTFAGQLTQRRGEDGTVRLSVYPGVGHADTVEMNVEIAMWFANYL